LDVIIGHVNADFDSLASMVAASKLYPEAVMVFAGSINRNVREFMTLHGDILEFREPRSLDSDAVTRLIVVDNRIASRLGELSEVLSRTEVEVFVYDHHPTSPHDMVDVKDYSEPVGSTTTILVKIIRRMGLTISPFEATLFALGIHEDTGSLTYAGTTHEDAESLAYLMRVGANMSVIVHFLGKHLSMPQHELMKRLFSNLEHYRIGGVLIALAKARMDEYVEGASLVAGKLADMENLEVLFALAEMGERVLVVGLSRLLQVDVDDILSGLGGGGHSKAGSAVMKGITLEEAEGKLLGLLREKVRKLVTAGEIMSGPVRTLHEETPITEASKRMERTGHTAFPVVDDEGELAGIISRKDLDKAGHHGLGHAPVKGFMSRNLISVDEDASLQEIQALMTVNAIGRVPVVKDKKLVGIVTRKDVIRALHGSEYLRGFVPPQKAPGYTRSEIVELIQRSLPGEMQTLLRYISKAAESSGYSVYLVGGMVRDLLLGYPNLDLDIVVEGEGIEFAQMLADLLKGRVRSHRKFGTAVVILPTGRRIDVATARTEFYEYPAALPTVEVSSIRQDLYRRDFTINAMAVTLTGEHFGEMLDYFGGLRDLERRHVRILHNLSFVEDPTRIFRAVRFEQRYGFQMERQTEMLARRAVEMEIVGKLTNARVRDELIYIFSEPNPLPFKAVQRLQDLGALKTLHPNLEVSEAMRERFNQLQLHMEEACRLVEGRCKVWIPPMAAMLAELPLSETEKWCHLMRFKRVDCLPLIQCVIDIKGTIDKISSGGLPPSGIVGLLDQLRGESLVYLYVMGGPGVRESVTQYIMEWRRIEPEISGKDLEEMGLPPSPAYTKVLNKVRADVLDGKVKGREEELELAKILVKGKEQE